MHRYFILLHCLTPAPFFGHFVEITQLKWCESLQNGVPVQLSNVMPRIRTIPYMMIVRK